MHYKEAEISAVEIGGVDLIVVESVAALVLILKSEAMWESLMLPCKRT